MHLPRTFRHRLIRLSTLWRLGGRQHRKPGRRRKLLRTSSSRLKISPRHHRLGIGYFQMCEHLRTLPIELQEPVCLSDWIMPNTHTKYDIIIAARERYLKRDPGISIFTGTDISYFRVEADERQGKYRTHLCNRFRFDYDPRQSIVEKPNHPLFHMHVVHEEPTIFPERFKKTRIIPSGGAIRERMDKVRIPTARMCFPSVLCLLVADHFGGEALHALLEETKEIRSKLLAPPPCGEWADHVHGSEGGKRFSGWHWYHRTRKNAVPPLEARRQKTKRR